MNFRIFLLAASLCLISLWGGRSWGQEPLTVSYQIEAQPDTTVLTVFLRSNTDSAFTVGAVNFSFLIDTSCTELVDWKSEFTRAWTPLLQRMIEAAAPDTERNGQLYNRRYLYGIANPGYEAARPLRAPPQTDSARAVMRLYFTGSCSQQVYMESESELRINQIGDSRIQPIPYLLIRLPGRD